MHTDISANSVILALEHLRSTREARVIDRDRPAAAFYLGLAADARRLRAA